MADLERQPLFRKELREPGSGAVTGRWHHRASAGRPSQPTTRTTNPELLDYLAKEFVARRASTCGTS